MDGDIIWKIVAIVFVVAAAIFDWPRTLAGLAVGYAGRRSGYPRLAIPLGVVAVAAAGELIYPLIGRTAEANWGSFAIGLVAAGVAAVGFLRGLYFFYDTAGSP